LTLKSLGIRYILTPMFAVDIILFHGRVRYRMEILNYKIDYKSKADEIDIIPLGDVHYENIGCDEVEFKKAVKEAVDNPKAHVLFMGDLLDSIKHGDKRFDFGHFKTKKAMERWGVFSSVKQMIKILKPLADENRIIGMLSGNHEETIRKRHEEEVVQYMAHELDVPWLTYNCFINLKFKRKNSQSRRLFQVYATHGYGGGRTWGYKINKLLGMSKCHDADIYLMAHDHVLADFLDTKISANIAGTRLEKHDRAYCYTGTFLKTHVMGYVTYPEAAGYDPCKIGYMKIKITPEHRRIATEKEYIGSTSLKKS